MHLLGGAIMKTLGGSLIIRDALKWDYPVIEALESLTDCCDKVVVGDCGSSDGTLERIMDWREMAGVSKKVKVVANLDWECIKGKERLSELTNQTRAHLDTDYHFNLQADEIIHERSFEHIRRVIEENPEGVHVRRFNLWGSWKTMVRLDLEGRKPVSDVVCRLAKTEYPSYGDGESINAPGTAQRMQIQIYHVGFIRDKMIMPHKVLNMQEKVFVMGGDSMCKKEAEEGRGFDSMARFSISDLEPVPLPLPRYIRGWIKY